MINSSDRREFVLPIVEAAAALLEDLDEAIADAALEAWPPYRISVTSFRESSDRLRSVLRDAA